VKKILSAIVALGLVIAPLNSFGQSLSVVQTEKVAKKNSNVGVIAAILAATVLVALILASSGDDKPTSP